MSTRALAMLIGLAALWGGSFLFIRIAVPAFGPPALVVGRVGIAAFVLSIYAWAIGVGSDLRVRWRAYLGLGLVNAALPFVLIAFAELHIPASLAAILNATTPLWGALVAAYWLNERLSPQRLVGMLIGVVGVAIVMGWGGLPITPILMIATAAMLLAACCYGIGGVLARRSFAGIAPLHMAIGQQALAGILMAPGILLAPPTSVPSLAAIGALVALALFSTALAYLLYFALIREIGATATLSVTMLVPVFGILWGAIFLSEPIGWNQVIGLGVILFGIRMQFAS